MRSGTVTVCVWCPLPSFYRLYALTTAHAQAPAVAERITCSPGIAARLLARMRRLPLPRFPLLARRRSSDPPRWSLERGDWDAGIFVADQCDAVEVLNGLYPAVWWCEPEDAWEEARRDCLAAAHTASGSLVLPLSAFAGSRSTARWSVRSSTG